MKRIHDFAAAKSLRAIVVLRSDGTHVATVRAHFGQSVVHVETLDLVSPDRDVQQGRAGGHGYDKFTAALSGHVIDGHKMTDHCGARLPLPEGCDVFPQGFEAPPGYTLANWVDEDRRNHRGLTPGPAGWTDCYRKEGLSYLRDLGYRLIEAI